MAQLLQLLPVIVLIGHLIVLRIHLVFDGKVIHSYIQLVLLDSQLVLVPGLEVLLLLPHQFKVPLVDQYLLLLPLVFLLLEPLFGSELSFQVFLQLKFHLSVLFA